MAAGAPIGEAFVRVRPDFDAAEFQRKGQEAGQSFGDAAKDVLRAGAFVVGAKAIVSAASEVEQAVGGTKAVFGEAASVIDDFASRSADAAGLSERAARQLTSQIGGMLKGFGFTRAEAAETSVTLTQLGADLAATFGGKPEEAVQALGAALRGEFDPLERFGVSLNITQANLKAVEMGLAESTSKVSLNARAQASLAIITERSADAQGQFGREVNTAQGQMDRARAKVEDAAASIGKLLLPAVTKAAQGIGFMADAAGDLPEPLQLSALGLAAIALVGPKVVSLFSSMGSAVGGFIGSGGGQIGHGGGLDGLRAKLLYTKDAITGTGSTLTGFSGVLTGVAIPALGAAAVAAGILAIAWQNHAREQAQNEAASKRLTERLKEQTGAVDEATEAWLRLEIAEGDRGKNIGQALAGTDADISKLTRGIRESGSELDRWRDHIYETGEGWGFLKGELEDAAASGNPAIAGMSSELLRLVETGQVSSSEAVQMARDFDFLNDRMDEGTIASRIYEQVTGDVGSAAKRTGAEIKAQGEEAEKAAAAQLDATQGVFEAQQKVADSTRDVEDAQLRLADVQRDGADVARSQREAQLSLVEAQEALLDVQRRIAGLPREREKAQLDLRDAELGVIEAEERLNEIRTDGKSDASDQERAEIGLARARLRVGDAEEAITEVARDQASAGTDLQRAQLGVEAAQARVNEAQSAGVQHARDLRDAQEGVHEAMLGAAQAAGELLIAQELLATKGHLTASEEAKIQAAELQKLADTMAPDSPLRAQLQAFIDELNAIPATREVRVKVTVDELDRAIIEGFAQSEDEGMRALERTLSTERNDIVDGPRVGDRSLDGKHVFAFDGKWHPVPGRATGGAVNEDDVYRGGERGMEVLEGVSGRNYFIPPEPGNVVPTSQLDGAGSTWNVAVTVNGAGDPEAVANRTVRKMRRAAMLVGGR